MQYSADFNPAITLKLITIRSRFMEMTLDKSQQKSSFIPMAIVAALFFILGFATWLNGSLMPYLKQILQLNPFQASLILFSFYIAVTFTALPSAWLIRKVGYKNGMALGMGVMMLAGLLFIPAAKTQVFALFLFAQLVMGAGQKFVSALIVPGYMNLRNWLKNRWPWVMLPQLCTLGLPW